MRVRFQSRLRIFAPVDPLAWGPPLPSTELVTVWVRADVKGQAVELLEIARVDNGARVIGLEDVSIVRLGDEARLVLAQ